jgi:pimeloyl-ACP methyl ester carboxylesterase
MHEPLLPSAAPAESRSHFISAPDGLRLHAAEYGPRVATALPMVCLPGLARTAEDFHALAGAMAGDAEHSRRVVAIDYRGRGQSEYDRNPANYAFPVELADLDAVLTALGVGRAVFVGTSRGGILTMLLAALTPTRIAGAVLNDIGPVIEPRGLMRIKSYVGKLPQPRNHAEGADILQRLFKAQFPNLSADDWLAGARLTWREQDGAFMPNYDPQLAQTLADVDLERAVPPLWAQFDALKDVPVMVIRGGLSDLLSAATVEAMRKRRRKLEVVEVPDQGHPPLLGTPEMIRRISAFLQACDAAQR